jgi:hypothetical protein
MLHIDKMIKDNPAQGQSNKVTNCGSGHNSPSYIVARNKVTRDKLLGRVKVIKDILLPRDKESIDKLLSKWNTFILSGKLHYSKFETTY